jgi:hypothetical protein
MEGEICGGGGSRGGRLGAVEGRRTASSGVGIVDGVEKVKDGRLASMMDEQLLGEEISEDGDSLSFVSRGDFIEGALEGNHVVVGDAALEAEDESAFEPTRVLREVERPRVVDPPVGGSLEIEGLVGGVIVELVQPVREPQGEGGGVGVDLGVSIEASENAVGLSSMEAFDFPMSLGISGGSVNDSNVELGGDPKGVVGDESRPTVEVEHAHEAISGDGLVEALKEEFGILGGTDEGGEAATSGIVEEVEDDALESLDPGPEVLSVGENHEHTVGIGEAAFVVGELLFPPGGKLQASKSPPDADAVCPLVWVEDPDLTGPAEKIGNGGLGIPCFLEAKKVEKSFR